MTAQETMAEPVSALAAEAIKRALPADKLTEVERIKLEAEVGAAIRSADWPRYEKEAEERGAAREMAVADSAKGGALSHMLSALHRPIWSLVTLGLYAWTVVTDAVLDQMQRDVMLAVIAFYFGGRSFEKVAKTRKGVK